MLRYYLYLISDFCVLFLIKSAPLGRLTPIEALPQTPQGTLSLDPASPLTPGLSLRFISRYARCWGTTMVSYAHSSFLIPHSSLKYLCTTMVSYANSSLLTPHLTGNSPFSTVASAISLISSQSCE